MTQELGKDAATLRIYDPYYCTGMRTCLWIVGRDIGNVSLFLSGMYVQVQRNDYLGRWDLQMSTTSTRHLLPWPIGPYELVA